MEPFGPRQEDLRAGVLASFAAAGVGVRVSPDDLYPSLAGPPAEPDGPEVAARKAAALWAVVKMVTANEGGVVVAKGLN